MMSGLDNRVPLRKRLRRLFTSEEPPTVRRPTEPEPQALGRSCTEPFEIDGLWAPADQEGEVAHRPRKRGLPRLRRWRATAQADDPDLPSPWPAYGTLVYDPEDRWIRVPTLGPTGTPFAGTAENDQVFHGSTLSKKPMSLLGGRFTQDGVLFGHARNEIQATMLVVGGHVTTLDELTFDRARVRLTGLLDFLWHPQRGGLGLQAHEHDSGRQTHHFQVDVPGAALHFHLDWEGSHGPHRRSAQRYAEVEIVSEAALTYPKLMRRWVHPLRDLVTFATRAPSVLVSVHAVLDEPEPRRWWQPDRVRPTQEKVVEFVDVPDDLVQDASGRRSRSLIFSLGELTSPEQTLGAWLALHQRLDVTASALATALSSRMYLQNRLITLTSVAEGYHRSEHDSQPLSEQRHLHLIEQMLDVCANNEERATYKSSLEHANSRSQRKRLTLLFDRAATALPALAGGARKQRRARASELATTRNFFVHLGDRDDEVRDGVELARLLQLLVLVLQANLLLDITGRDTGWVAQALQRAYRDHTGRVGEAARGGAPSRP